MNYQQGISIYLSFIIMTILLAVALGMSTIFLGQSKIIKSMGNSVIAFYAADSGIEEVLSSDRSSPSSSCSEAFPCSLDNDASYYLIIVDGASCGAVNYCIKSIGTYQNTRRAVEISY